MWVSAMCVSVTSPNQVGAVSVESRPSVLLYLGLHPQSSLPSAIISTFSLADRFSAPLHIHLYHLSPT